MVMSDGEHRTLSLGRFVSSGVLDAVEAVGSSDVRTSSVYCLSHLDEVGFEGTRSTSSCQGGTQLQSTHLAQFLTPERYPDTAERLMERCCEDAARFDRICEWCYEILWLGCVKVKRIAETDGLSASKSQGEKFCMARLNRIL